MIGGNMEEDGKKGVVEGLKGILGCEGWEVLEGKEWGKGGLGYEIKDLSEG